jgi:hypothetical protein
MPRFYFHLTSKDSRIPDESGKELNTLNDAYVYARNLILFHVGYDDAEAWKVIISNDSYEAQMVVPFPMSYSHRAHLHGLHPVLIPPASRTPWGFCSRLSSVDV